MLHMPTGNWVHHVKGRFISLPCYLLFVILSELLQSQALHHNQDYYKISYGLEVEATEEDNHLSSFDTDSVTPENYSDNQDQDQEWEYEIETIDFSINNAETLSPDQGWMREQNTDNPRRRNRSARGRRR